MHRAAESLEILETEKQGRERIAETQSNRQSSSCWESFRRNPSSYTGGKSLS